MRNDNHRLELVKEDERGKTYRLDIGDVAYRVRGSMSGDNSINAEELIYLVSGRAKAIVNGKNLKLEAPARLHIPAKTHHSIEALTDIVFMIITEPVLLYQLLKQR